MAWRRRFRRAIWGQFVVGDLVGGPDCGNVGGVVSLGRRRSAWTLVAHFRQCLGVVDARLLCVGRWENVCGGQGLAKRIVVVIGVCVGVGVVQQLDAAVFGVR